jgi:hypothetical protein
MIQKMREQNGKRSTSSLLSQEKKIEETTEDEHPEGMEGKGDKMRKSLMKRQSHSCEWSRNSENFLHFQQCWQ